MKLETLGKFVLLEELERNSLGIEHRSVLRGPGGVEKTVRLLRVSPELSCETPVAGRILHELGVAAQLRNPSVNQVLECGRIDGTLYACSDYVEGKSLQAVLVQAREAGTSMTTAHVLFVLSKVCSALDYAHSRRFAGRTYFHGLVTPAKVLVSYEGEVRLDGFGRWPALGDARLLSALDRRHLSPEQWGGHSGDPRSDVFEAGLLLFEALAGEPLYSETRREEPEARLAGALLLTAEGAPMPEPLMEILQRALAADPAARYGHVRDMGQAVDSVLFSGEFTRTTFNLTPFVKGLFQADIDAAAKRRHDEAEQIATFLGAAVSTEATAPEPSVRPARAHNGAADFKTTTPATRRGQAAATKAPAEHPQGAKSREPVAFSPPRKVAGSRRPYVLLALLGALLLVLFLLLARGRTPAPSPAPAAGTTSVSLTTTRDYLKAMTRFRYALPLFTRRGAASPFACHTRSPGARLRCVALPLPSTESYSASSRNTRSWSVGRV